MGMSTGTTTTSPIQMQQLPANQSQSQPVLQAPVRQSTGGSLSAKLAAARPIQSFLTVTSSQGSQQQTFSDDEKRTWAFKFKGYPALARWMGASEDFFLIRRFGDLNARILLAMQDDIMQLEERLQTIDKRYEDAFFDKATQKPLTPSRNDTLRCDPDPERRQILGKLRPMLKEYSMTSFVLQMYLEVTMCRRMRHRLL